MFISEEAILNSIGALQGIVHPFHGITFLVCKREKLPIGNTTEIQLDSHTKAHLDRHHKIDPDSAHYFQPFKSTSNWVKHNYASSGLQAINTQTFRSAFIHPSASRSWGWSPDYIDVVASKLTGGSSKIPGFSLAVWLYKDVDWDEGSDASTVHDKLIDEYNITSQEVNRLFNGKIPTEFQDPNNLFSERLVNWASLRSYLPPPPDAAPDTGGSLSYLEISGTGPTHNLVFEPAKHLSLITGDNGLGKSFLLECAWWALTGNWSGVPALPRSDSERDMVFIEFLIQGDHSAPAQRTKISYDWQSLSWPSPRVRPTIPGLIVYARVDGSFAVWDPVKSAVSSGKRQNPTFFKR